MKRKTLPLTQAAVPAPSGAALDREQTNWSLKNEQRHAQALMDRLQTRLDTLPVHTLYR